MSCGISKLLLNYLEQEVGVAPECGLLAGEVRVPLTGLRGQSQRSQPPRSAKNYPTSTPRSGGGNWLARVARFLTCCGEAQTWRWESTTLQEEEAEPLLGEEEAAMAAAMVVERSSGLLVVGVREERRTREAVVVARGDRNRRNGAAAADDDGEAIIGAEPTSGFGCCHMAACHSRLLDIWTWPE